MDSISNLSFSARYSWVSIDWMSCPTSDGGLSFLSRACALPFWEVGSGNMVRRSVGLSEALRESRGHFGGYGCSMCTMLPARILRRAFCFFCAASTDTVRSSATGSLHEAPRMMMVVRCVSSASASVVSSSYS